MQIKLLVEGGDMKPGPALAQKLGPTGINVNQVIQKVNEVTKEFKGMKVPVLVDLDINTKSISTIVSSPPVSELLKKDLGIEKGSGSQKNIQVANAPIERIIYVAKTKLSNMLAKDMKSAVKLVLGSCVSLGILVENKSPKVVIQEIDEGKYDKIIKEELTEPSEEKRKELEKFFEDIKKKQEVFVKQEEAKKQAESAEAKVEEKKSE